MQKICHFVGYYAFIKDGSAVLWIIVVLFLTVFWLVGVLVLVVCSCEVLHVVVLFLVAWAWWVRSLLSVVLVPWLVLLELSVVVVVCVWFPLAANWGEVCIVVWCIAFSALIWVIFAILRCDRWAAMFLWNVVVSILGVAWLWFRAMLSGLRTLGSEVVFWLVVGTLAWLVGETTFV